MTDELNAAVERAWECALNVDCTPPWTPPRPSEISIFIRALADEPEVMGHLVQAPRNVNVYTEDVRDIIRALAEIVK
jgi:hypothetical protein